MPASVQITIIVCVTIITLFVINGIVTKGGKK